MGPRALLDAVVKRKIPSICKLLVEFRTLKLFLITSVKREMCQKITLFLSRKLEFLVIAEQSIKIRHIV
jgi:hypothetical protein